LSRFVMMELQMKEDLPMLYDIYFRGQVLLHYEEEIPFIVVGTTSKMDREAAIEFLRGCEEFKAYHMYLFGTEVKAFVMDDKQFKKVDNWWNYFHPNGIYR
jgi:hypothetical protein